MNTLGVRIPGMVISPLVGRGTCFHGLLDHTSILQLMVERFGSPGDLGSLGVAAQRKNNGVGSLSQLVTLGGPRADDALTLPNAPIASGSAVTPPVSNMGRMFRGVIADQPATKVGGG
jgi:phospholipase C